MANGLTKAEKKVETMEERQARARARSQAQDLQIKEVAAGAVIGLALGAIDARMPTLLTGFGPGGYLKLDYILAFGGAYLAFNGKAATREYGSAACVIGVANLARPYGTRLAAGFGGA